MGAMSSDGTFVWRKKKMDRQLMSTKSEKKRRRERIAELDKMKRRRQERAVEKAQHEEKMALLARERARAEFHDLEKREKELDFHQSKLRSEIRLREGRAKPIDILIMTCYAANPPPQASYIFKGLTLEQREELHNDIKQQMQYYEEMKNMDITTRRRYWEALLVVSQWELAEASMMKQMDDALILRGLHESVEEDVNSLLAGKTYVELEALQSQIESQMQSGAAKVVEYWEALLKRLHLHKAKAFLKENYNTQESESVHDDNDDDEEGTAEQVVLEEDGPAGASYDDDKYCHQRRPKYLNRVHTGYEWNKYNRTHYDHDNPPPKKVQGYKFNIFYPDLIDQSRPPIYTVEKDDDPEADSTCIIRFRGGPPYQDIAFRIVNGEWEYSRKKGFKSTFEHGVLRLYFNFKRFSYRR